MSKKISELTTATDVTVNDFFQVVDLEDPTMASSGTNKKVSARTLGNNLPVTATGSSASRTLRDRFADSVNVKDFGAVGDGVTDDTAAIQAAINSLSIKGGVIVIGAGTYRVSSTINVSINNVYIEGQGNNSVILRSTDYGNTFLFTGNTTNGTLLTDVGISNIKITSLALTTSGAHVKTDGVWRMKIENIYLQDGFIGFDLGGLLASTISNVYVVFTSLYSGNSSGRKYMTFRNASAAFSHRSSGDVFVNNFNLRGNTSNQITEYGIEIISSDGIWFENGHVGNSSVSNILINANTVEMVNLIYFSNVMSDEGLGSSLLLDGGTSSIYNIVQFTNCTFKSGGSPSYCPYGIVFAATCYAQNVMFTGCSVTEFGKSAVTVSGANSKNIYFSNCNVFNNGSDIGGPYPAYNFLAGSEYISVTNGKVSGVNQSYGIQFGGSHSNIIIDAVDLTGNSIDSINGFNLSVNVRNCLIQGNINVASASTISPPLGEDLQYITGTTNINNIQPSQAGRIIVLNFQGGLTVSDSVGNIKLNGSFTSTVDDTLTLIYNGADWVEIARSQN